jgi:hypothetical protein
MQRRLSSTSLSRKAGRCARLLCLLLRWSHLSIGSAMPQRAPAKMTKTWCPPNTLTIRLRRTLIPGNQPLRRGITLGSMRVADGVSASRMDLRTLTVYFSVIIIAHYMCYTYANPCGGFVKMLLTSELLETCTILQRIIARPKRERSNQAQQCRRCINLQKICYIS